MVAGRLTHVRTLVATPTGRITHVRTRAGAAAGAGRITRVRTRVGVLAGYTVTAEPFANVTLPAGTWTQTGGPTVTTPSFLAPALPTGATLTFTATGQTATVTVLPHTRFRRIIGGWEAVRQN